MCFFPGHADPGAQGIPHLFESYRLGKHQARTQPESIGHPGFAFDDGNGDGGLIQTGGAGAIENLGGILHVVAVDDQQVKALRCQSLQRKRRFTGMLEADFQFIQDLSDSLNRFLIAA